MYTAVYNLFLTILMAKITSEQSLYAPALDHDSRHVREVHPQSYLDNVECSYDKLGELEGVFEDNVHVALPHIFVDTEHVPPVLVTLLLKHHTQHMLEYQQLGGPL